MSFIPRDYQKPIVRAFLSGKYKRYLLLHHRRAGKDIVAFSLIVHAALNKVGVYYYVFPTFSQARRVIWTGMTNEGQRFLDFIPKGITYKTNEQQMSIRFENGSLLQFVGSDDVDKLVGSNPLAIVFSEYALQDPRAYQFLRPILVANDGWAMFVSTSRGKNHFYELYKIAQDNPKDWFISRLTIDDTGVVSPELIQKERDEGLMSEDLIQQEYYVSFDAGVEGAYYAKYLDRLKLLNQITLVPWEPAFPVHTAWDIGVRDSTAIIFFQQIGGAVRVIDCYEKTKEGLEHYVHYLKEKPYTYGKHVAPHDIRVKEFGTGFTRWEKARQLGITFTIAPQLSVSDGIEAVRSTLPKMYFDEHKTKPLLKAIENYRQEWDSKRRIYKPHPLHDIHSNFADSLRYLCISLPKTSDSMTQEDAQRLHHEAHYGSYQHNPYSPLG